MVENKDFEFLKRDENTLSKNEMLKRELLLDKLFSEKNNDREFSDDDEFKKFNSKKFSNDDREPLTPLIPLISDNDRLHKTVYNIFYQFRFLFILNIIKLALNILILKTNCLKKMQICVNC